MPCCSWRRASQYCNFPDKFAPKSREQGEQGTPQTTVDHASWTGKSGDKSWLSAGEKRQKGPWTVLDISTGQVIAVGGEKEGRRCGSAISFFFLVVQSAISRDFEGSCL